MQSYRREFLASISALGAATSLHAAAPMLGASNVLHRRFVMGDFEVTTLLAGTRAVDDPHSIFGLDASDEDFAKAAMENNIPSGQAQFFFTPTIVNTGSELVLFDTGMNPEGIVNALSVAGYTPEQVDVVVLTHMHPDHIGGLSGEAGVTFPNARYVTGAVEFDAWDLSGNEGFESKVRPLAENMQMIAGGESVASGIEAVEAFGHTPGHMAYMLDSGGKQLLIAADFANHYVFSLAYPDWQVLYDQDKSAAAATRRKLLAMLASEKMPFIGYHMPFPAVGFVESSGDGYAYQPMSYQLML